MKNLNILIYLFFLPNLIFAQINKIIETYNIGNYKIAYEMIQNELKLDSVQAEHYYYKSLIENHSQNYAQAITSLNQGINLTSKSDSLYLIMMYFLSENFDLNLQIDEAIENINTVLKEEPKNIDALNNISYYYMQKYQYDSSFKVLYKAFDLDSSKTMTLQNLAYLCALVTDFRSATKYAEMALKYPLNNLNKSSVLNSLGLSQSKLLSKEIGIKTVEEGLKYSPNNMYSYLTLGLIYLDYNELDLACKYFYKSRELGGINLTINLLKNCK